MFVCCWRWQRLASQDRGGWRGHKHAGPEGPEKGPQRGTWRGHVRGRVPNREAGHCLGIRRTGQVTGQASVGLAKGQDAPSSPQGPAGLFPLGKWADAQAEMKTPSERGSRTRSVNLR